MLFTPVCNAVTVFVWNRKQFGQVVDLSKDEFVTAIDDEKSNVTIVVHIFEKVIYSVVATTGDFLEVLAFVETVCDVIKSFVQYCVFLEYFTSR